MTIYFLNCGTMRPYFPHVENGVTCLLVETNQCPLLADTGFGIRDYSSPTRSMSIFLSLMRSARAVKHIIQTHLHLDHAGGLPDFPHAQVHVLRLEYKHVISHGSWEYRPEHWARGFGK